MQETLTASFTEHWVAWLFAIVLSTLVLNFLSLRFLRVLSKAAKKTKGLWDDAFLGAIGPPLGWAIWLFGLNLAVQYTAAVNDLPWGAIVPVANKTVFIVLLAWSLLRFIARAERNLTSSHYLREPVDHTTAKAVRKLVQLAVFITASLVLLQLYGLSISGVLAFGGIGGIAVGFAARDLLANFFGALTIYLDKPFSVGDWIRSPDREIEGTVEDIGWRLTIIRTFDKRPLYVPNSVFTSIAVENPSRMTNRRIYETFGLRCQDTVSLPNVVSRVKTMLSEHAEIDTNQVLIVNFNQISASSLDFFVYTLTKTTDWVKYHGIKQDVLLKIAEIVEAEGAEFAFPTQTLHLKTEGMPPFVPQSPIESLAAQQGNSAKESSTFSEASLSDTSLPPESK